MILRAEFARYLIEKGGQELRTLTPVQAAAEFTHSIEDVIRIMNKPTRFAPLSAARHNLLRIDPGTMQTHIYTVYGKVAGIMTDLEESQVALIEVFQRYGFEENHSDNKKRRKDIVDQKDGNELLDTICYPSLTVPGLIFTRDTKSHFISGYPKLEQKIHSVLWYVTETQPEPLRIRGKVIG